MNEDAKNFLESLKEIETDKVKVFVKSLNKEMDATPFTFKQQKDIISTVVEGGVGALKLQKHLNDFILLNLGEDVLVSDKIGIIVQLRMDSIGEKITIDEKEYDLSQIVENFRKAKSPKKTKIIKDKINVTVKIPTLKEENKITNSTIEAFKKNGDEMSKSLGQIFTYEIAKFIEKVEFNEKGVVFDDISVMDRLKIVESLPLSTNKKIVEFIQDVKRVETESLQFDDGVSVDIDVSFFDG